MQPEISHRCSACGASTRDFSEGVLFCPECGQALTAADKGGESKRAGAPEPAAASLLPQGDAARPAGNPSAPPEKSSNYPEAERATARERTRETLQRASQKTRGAIEGNVKRVEKIHQVSSVVLEEATYDPSLRFVLVAVGLFLLFVILLILSKVMG
ncbi:MAG TPA: hypothetical protein VE961_28475 [Pyrinomonadaceae bacterium]|nr:hypothetical protein [Pyrinomonadaceae bacterium]